MTLHRDPQQVFLNLLEFKEAIFERGRLQKMPTERTYGGFLHPGRGAFVFAEPSSEKERWKQIRLRVHSQREGDKFFLLDEKEEPFHLSQISERAQEITRATLSLLNRRCNEVSSREEPIEAVILQDLQFVRRFFSQEIEKHPGWMGEISRFEAEKLLKDHPEGTYLIRHGDHLTEKTVESLFQRCAFMIFFVLTYSEKKKKVRERLILWDAGWFIYNDEPDLGNSLQKRFSDVDSLFRSIPEIKMPYRGKGR